MRSMFRPLFRSLMVVWLCVGAGSLATGCSSSTAETQPSNTNNDRTAEALSWPVDQPGPYQVGYKTWEVSYQPPGMTDKRTIRLHMWYPSKVVDGEHPKYEKIFEDSDVVIDAAPEPPLYNGKYPVHVHSHGYRGFGGTSSDMMHYFATHGWVAIAPDHTDNILSNFVEPLPFSHYYLRALDIKTALDTLENLPAEDPLSGKCATDKVLMSGHSFGTHTTWTVAGASFDEAAIRQACMDKKIGDGVCPEDQIALTKAGFRDARVVAAIPMAGGQRPEWFGATGFNQVKIPMMLMTGTDDSPDGAGTFAAVQGVDLTWISIEGGCHQVFGLGGCQKIDEKLGFSIVNTYALALGRRNVLADSDAKVLGILNGSQVVSEKALFQHK
jgi:predicted dienelactone hydrolase